MNTLFGRCLLIFALVNVLTGCNTPFKKLHPESPAPVVTDGFQETEKLRNGIQVSTKEESLQREGQDRMNRVKRLARERKIKYRPEIKLVQVERFSENGLPSAFPVLRIRFSDMAFFDFNSDKFRSDSTQAIDLVADALKRDLPDTQVLLLGHTDSVGTAEYNMDLSKRRAIAVMKALKKRGISFSQMTTVAIGEMQPLKTNTTPEGRSINRRVEFFISADHEANMQVVRESDFCESYINDQDAGNKGTSGVTETPITSLADLGIIRLTDDLQIVHIASNDYDHGGIAVEETIERDLRKAVGSPFLHSRKKIRDY
jgi:outer membrane protein OmpA-like peptidoglycan-associated protein